MSKWENKIGIKVPEILLPGEGVDYKKWAVVACDQYTSEPAYWEETERIVGNAPSTLRLMLPELYLDKPDEAERIAKIRETMEQYKKDGTLKNYGEGFVLLRRTTGGNTRVGMVVALDLENYDYTKGSTTLIRATEGTIVERIPPRLRIRRGAPVELPHILILIDDPEKTAIEPVNANVTSAEKVYDFDMMQNGGHIEGYFIKDEAKITSFIKALEALVAPERLKKMYGDLPALLFALGDGNHSFATAKANWEEIKKTLPESERATHPARYALVEIENVHDKAIIFEPIHRVLFNVDAKALVPELTELLKKNAKSVEYHTLKDANELKAVCENTTKGVHKIPYCAGNEYGCFEVKEPNAQLEVGTLQTALDVYLKAHTDVKIDYVHGADVVIKLAGEKGNCGFLLPSMDKGLLFPTVMRESALPRKTFSMGEANEKRYYLECRDISGK